MQETPAALEAFERYWQMGPVRSLEKLAEADIAQKHTESKQSTRFQQLKTWSTEHNWQDRLKQRIAAEAAEFREEMKERASGLKRRVAAAIEVDIRKYLKRLEKSDAEMLAANAADVDKMVKLYMQIAEQPLGERLEIMGKDGGPVQVATVPVFNDADPLNHIDKPDTESNGNDSGPDDDTT